MQENEHENGRPPVYAEHEGTIRVAGASKPLLLAQCAQSMITRGVDPIEFFYIGGNAGQQAMKAMTILAYQIDRESASKTEALFSPLRVLTMTKDDQEHEKEKDATCWRLVLVSKN